MTSTEILNSYGEENLVSVPENLLEPATLPADTKTFLAQVGVPKKCEFTFDGNSFKALPFRTSPEARASGEYIMLDRLPDTSALLLASSDDPHIFVCVREGQGIVEMANTFGDVRQFQFLFINSSVQVWMKCVLIFQTFASMSGEKDRAFMRKFERQLQQTDPQAFQSRSYYWPVYFDNVLY